MCERHTGRTTMETHVMMFRKENNESPMHIQYHTKCMHIALFTFIFIIYLPPILLYCVCRKKFQILHKFPFVYFIHDVENQLNL